MEIVEINKIFIIVFNYQKILKKFRKFMIHFHQLNLTLRNKNIIGIQEIILQLI